MRLTEAGNAEVFAGGQVYDLPGVIAGSGTRYTNGSVEYWEHGNEAMLNGAAGGPYAQLFCANYRPMGGPNPNTRDCGNSPGQSFHCDVVGITATGQGRTLHKQSAPPRNGIANWYRAGSHWQQYYRTRPFAVGRNARIP